MMLFSLVCALLFEWIRPRSSGVLIAPFLMLRRVFADALQTNIYVRQGWGVWWLVVIVAFVVCVGLYSLLWRIHPLFALIFNVVVLYLTLDLGHADRHFAEIQLALRMGETDRAAQLLGQWRGEDVSGSSASQIARLSIEQLLTGMHRGIFGASFWFVLLPGPSGALLYRLACHFAKEVPAVNEDGQPVGNEGAFAVFSCRAFEIIDWLPARLTAFTFAVMGDFENAVYCARTQAVFWPDKAAGRVLASAGGALGIRLGAPIETAGGCVDRPELGVGVNADAEGMQNAVRLIWRALLLCLLVLVLLSLAG